MRILTNDEVRQQYREKFGKEITEGDFRAFFDICQKYDIVLEISYQYTADKIMEVVKRLYTVRYPPMLLGDYIIHSSILERWFKKREK